MTSISGLIWDNRRAYKKGADAIAERQRARFAEMVVHARAKSPFYRSHYRDSPARVEDPELLPTTNKAMLMARFDEWSSDRDVTLAEAEAFAQDTSRIGERFRGRYTLATTSGTTGRRGIFLLDDRSMAVTNAVAVRMLTSWLTGLDLLKLLIGGGRMAMVMATGGHFASTVAAARLQRGRGPRLSVLSAQMPLPEIVAQLNPLRPAIVAAYARMAALLAGEQQAGRLRIRPVLLALSAEGLDQGQYKRIGETSGAKIGNSYAATECPFMSYSCNEGWLHVNSDWVKLEPVDAQHRPVPPGDTSHTVLISNLANRLQPILRYDLGDSVVERPDPCPCGSPLMAIRVTGRSGDALVFTASTGSPVTIVPGAFAIALGDVPGIQLWQLAQTSPTRLRLRLRMRLADHRTGDAWMAACAKLERLLHDHGVGHVAIERAEEPPEQTASGKFRQILPVASDRAKQ